MATDLGTAVASIGLDYSKLETGIAASKSLVGGLGVGLLGVAGIALGAGIAATKMAGDFQSGLTSLVTGAGESQKNLGLVSDGILSLATTTGTSTKDLVAGMYMIESAGYHGAQGLDVLKAAAEGAKVGSASLADIANGVTTAMTDYSSSNLTAAQATNDLIATVAAGKTHMGDLARSMSNILPVASAVHVSFGDVSAAMATMTGEGTSAELASTYLKQVLLALTVPSAGATKALASIGLTSKEVATDLQKSLPDTLQLITDDIGKKFPAGSQGYIDAVKAISGGSKNMMAMLDLTGTHMDTFRGNLKNITDATKQGGDSINGWTLVQQDFNTKMDQAREVVETLGIKIGTALLPVAGKLLDTVMPLITSFDDWITKSSILNQVTSDLTGLLSNASGFIDNIAGSANACGTQFDGLHGYFADFQTIAQNVHDLLPDIATFLTNVGTDVQQNLLPPLESLVGNVAKAATNFSNWLDKSGTAKQILQGLSGVVGTVSSDLGTLIGWVSKLVGWLGGGGAGTTTLVGTLTVLAGAFVALKIADATSQFAGFLTKISSGEGIISNLASAFKDKLGGAVDGFLQKQAPNFKQAMDDFKAKSQNAAAAEEEVGTTAEGKMATGVKTGSTEAEASLLGVENQAGTTGTSVEGIGADSEIAAGEVTGASMTMEGDMSAVEGAAHAAAAAETGVGTAAGGATTLVGGLATAIGGIVSVVGVGMAEFMLAKWMKDQGWIPDASKNGPSWITHQNLNQHARGGTNLAPGWALVGEEGPELVNLHGGEDIYPHGTIPTSSLTSSGGTSNASPLQGSSGGGVTVHVYPQIFLDGQELGHSMVSSVATQIVSQARASGPVGKAA